MSLNYALLTAVIIQFAAAVIALSLIRRNEKNIAWWLISFGFVLMAVRRLLEFLNVWPIDEGNTLRLINSWIGIGISVIMLFSLGYIKRILNIQRRFEDLKKKNEARIFTAILRTEEEQKQKFSKDLHDGLGPLLSSVKMTISGVKNNPDSAKSSRILMNAEHLIDESIQTIKEISNNLSPHILNNFGLYRAIRSFIQNLDLEGKPEIIYNTNIDSRRFPYNIETVVYRIICELITNTLRHANARHVYLDMFYENELLRISYIDDGKGFEFKEELSELSGLGLMNIQSRVKSVQGTCEIFSKPNEGFTVKIEIHPR